MQRLETRKEWLVSNIPTERIITRILSTNDTISMFQLLGVRSNWVIMLKNWHDCQLSCVKLTQIHVLLWQAYKKFWGEGGGVTFFKRGWGMKRILLGNFLLEKQIYIFVLLLLLLLLLLLFGRVRGHEIFNQNSLHTLHFPKRILKIQNISPLHNKCNQQLEENLDKARRQIHPDP